jgi:hypothetical protein
METIRSGESEFGRASVVLPDLRNESTATNFRGACCRSIAAASSDLTSGLHPRLQDRRALRAAAAREQIRSHANA